MTLSIGPITLSDPVILAPMSGVTDLPFRRLVKRIGAGLVVSEMIASQAMIRQNRETLRLVSTVPEEFPMAVQLAGCEPEVMADAARLNQDRGAAIIDLNFGCPVKKVVNGFAGSALMRDEALAGRILETVVKAVSIPVTLKMRLGWDDDNRNAPTLARIAQQCGIRMITVHGRTRMQMYTGTADWAAVRPVAEAVDLPVVVNGDIANTTDARRAMEQSGAAGVMIGRGACGRPWRLGQIIQGLRTGREGAEPPLAEQLAVLLEHYEAMLIHYGIDHGLKVARKHISWYTNGLPASADFRNEVNRIADPAAVRDRIRAFYGPLIERMAA